METSDTDSISSRCRQAIAVRIWEPLTMSNGVEKNQSSPTIAIIGVGAVGSTTAYSCIVNNLAAHLILVDVDKQRCHGQVLDLSDVLPFSHTSSISLGSFADAAQADIIIITAGIAQKKGQIRDELAQANSKIVADIANKLTPIKQDAVIIVVTNPVDLITWQLHDTGLLPCTQIIGSGTFLDTQRLRVELSQLTNVADQSINAYVLGEHGDSQFCPWSSADITGIAIKEYPGITQQQLDTAANNTRQKAYDIIECKGATYFGIASCVSSLCAAILFNQQRIIPVSAYIEQWNVVFSMPAVIGHKGIEKLLSVPLNEHEQQQAERSATAIKELRKSL